MKQCKAEGCNSSVFSHSYCIGHQSYRKDESYLKSLLKKLKTGKIKPKSSKRIKQDVEYKEVGLELEEELKAKGGWVCIFCGIPFSDYESYEKHHLFGRDGELMTDKKFIRPSHSNCHFTYHQSTLAKLKSMFWYEGFLERIKIIDINLYNKEKRKEWRQ